MNCELVGAAVGCLSRVPDVVWSGVISALVAAGVALLGVLLTNAGSLSRLKKQHDADVAASAKQREHDAEQKAQDRKSLIRREVYTAAIGAAHDFLAALARLPMRPSDAADDDKELQVLLAANSKVWLVADLEGAELSRHLATQAGLAFIEILGRSKGFRQSMDRPRELEKLINFASAEELRVAQKITDAMENGQDADLARRKVVLERVNKWLNDTMAERTDLLRSLAPAQGELARHTIEVMKPMQATLVKLVSSLRREIGLEPALDVFEAIAEDQLRRLAPFLQPPLPDNGGAAEIGSQGQKS